MNLASEELVLANPKLLDDREKLLRLARIKVNDDGYVYKKGKSRSKQFNECSSSEVKQDKRTKTSEYVRTQRILHLEDSLKDIDKQIGFKELRREQAANSRQYQICDEITHEITVLKKQRYQEQVELKALQRKQQQSKWFKKKKPMTSDKRNESNESTSTSFSSSHSSKPTKRSSQLVFQPVKRKCSANLSESSENLEKEEATESDNNHSSSVVALSSTDHEASDESEEH